MQQTHVGQHLRLMHANQPLHALNLDYNMIGDDKVGTVLPNQPSFVGHRNRHLSHIGKARVSKLDAESLFVGHFR